MYRLALAYQGKGDQAKSAELFERRPNQNSLPALNYSFVRAKAKEDEGVEGYSAAAIG